jgi:hypothetical protein
MFSLLYGLSVVISMCCDATFNSCGPWSYAPHTNRHLPVEPANRVRRLLYSRICLKKKWFSCQQNQPFEEDVSHCLSWLSVIVRALVQSRAPLSDPPMSCRTPCWPPIFADWSQFCHKAVSNFILSYSLQLFLWWLSGRSVVNLWK